MYTVVLTLSTRPDVTAATMIVALNHLSMKVNCCTDDEAKEEDCARPSNGITVHLLQDFDSITVVHHTHHYCSYAWPCL